MIRNGRQIAQRVNDSHCRDQRSRAENSEFDRRKYAQLLGITEIAQNIPNGISDADSKVAVYACGGGVAKDTEVAFGN